MNTFKNFLVLDSSTAKHFVLRLSTPKKNYDAPTETNHLESTLIPSIDNLLQEAQKTIQDIDAFVLGAGPGSFMGLRLGFSVLRTWAWLYDKPIIKCSSLELLLRSFTHLQEAHTLYVPCIDGKMKRVFAHIQKKNTLLLEDSDIFPEQLAQHIVSAIKKHHCTNTIIIGSGAELLREFLPNDLGITFHQEAVIHHHCFERSFLENLNSSLFSQKSTDQLTAIEPSYLRVSAAEMSLLEKENSLKKNPS